jgi:signal transduction histidine kinase
VELPRSRSIRWLLVFASVAFGLTLALGYGWTRVIRQNVSLSQRVAPNAWLMVGGLVAFLVIATVLVLFTLYQVREISENKRQTRFIDSVTHELKSPLASLKLAVETLRRRELDRDQRDRLHDMMVDDIERLNTFIDDILESSRVGHDRGHNMTEIELRSLTESVVERLLRRHRVRAPVVRIEVPAEIRIVSDRVAMETVLKNLVDNALKYSDPPAQVVVSACAGEAGRIVIEVQDQGIGIPKDELAKVFDRFYRVDREDVRLRKGTGLGLHVVDSLVRSLGGRMEAQSAGTGQGTTMQVRLPIRQRGKRGGRKA